MIRHVLIALAVIGVSCGASVAFAHSEVALPAPGLAPSNFFYFLDRIGEAIQNIFTFGAENKANLQIRFAAERVSEISLERSVNGDQSPGIVIAKRRMDDHLKKASAILDEAEIAGEEVLEERMELIGAVNGIFESADWLDEFFEEFDEADNSVGIPDEGEPDEK